MRHAPGWACGGAPAVCPRASSAANDAEASPIRPFSPRVGPLDTTVMTDTSTDPGVEASVTTAKARPVKPRDAATLILVRRDNGKAQILMGRRNRGHSF